jgi:2,3-dihydroxyethylbenzene 1,2-dioxygenase
MIQVTELGYMGIGVKDLDAWKNFAANIVGLELADEGERDRCYLRMDYFHHRIVMHQDPSDDLQYLGFRVAGAEEFGAMQRQLSEAGIKFRLGSEDEANERRVLEVLKLQDPGGNPVEIFHGPEVQFQKPFYPGRPMHGRFKTGTGGLGHCIIRQQDPVAAQKFYHALGMRGGVEYKIKIGNGYLQIRFMHCNDRDHTVAFGVPGGSKMLNHIMLEVDNFDDVGMTHELVRKQKVPVAMGIGKHSNDHMYSFYFNTPSGWMIEYGCGARASTYQSEYYTRDIYGHQAEGGGFGMPE